MNTGLSVPANTTKTLKTSTTMYGLMIVYAGNSNACGAWIVLIRNGSGSALAKEIVGGSNLTVTTSGTDVKVQNSYSSAANIAFMPLGNGLRSWLSLV